MSWGNFKVTAFTGKKLQLGVCGSVAAFKALELLRAFVGLGIKVNVTLTSAAKEFVTPLSFTSLGAGVVYQKMFAPDESIFAHLEPGQGADAFLVAPASATSMARFAAGTAEEMLSAQVLAFAGPLLVAPAMHPKMWGNKATQDNKCALQQRGATFIMPEKGRTACGDEGEGRLAGVDEIFAQTLRALAPKDLEGKKVMVTLGPTREFWDAARFISNPSSGLMGAGMAIAAWLRGASVSVISGPCNVWLPKEITRTNVTSAEEMHSAANDIFKTSDIGCFTAAVSDFRPTTKSEEKRKKSSDLSVAPMELAANPDILLSIGQNKKPGQKIIAFAAETSDLQNNATAKMQKKNADMIVANIIGREGSGFESFSNIVSLFGKNGQSLELPQLPKTEVAWKVWDFFLKI